MGFTINQFLKWKKYQEKKGFEKRAKAFSEELEKLCEKYGVQIGARLEIYNWPAKAGEKENGDKICQN